MLRMQPFQQHRPRRSAAVLGLRRPELQQQQQHGLSPPRSLRSPWGFPPLPPSALNNRYAEAEGSCGGALPWCIPPCHARGCRDTWDPQLPQGWGHPPLGGDLRMGDDAK